MRSGRWSLTRLALVMALGFVVAGCSGGSDQTAAPVAQIDADAPPLHSFDIYAVGNAEGNILFGDIYGITLKPFKAYRLTADKRISWITANASTIALAAGDEQIDKLGLLSEGGIIVPLPGLGRPHAFAPEFQSDGTLRFSDLGAGDAVVNRYVSYDFATGKTNVLFKTKDDIEIDAAAPGSGFLAVDRPRSGDARIVLRSFTGASRSFTIAQRIGSPVAGKRLIAVGTYGSSNVDEPATDIAVLDPKSGKINTIKGWAPLGWTPDGQKILAVRTGIPALRDAELAVIDPAHPATPEILGSIPGLTLYAATWIDRSGAAG